MSKRLKNFLLLLGLIALSFLTLRVVIGSTGEFSFDRFTQMIRGIKPLWIILAFVCAYGYIFFEGLGLRFSCKFLGHPISHGQSMIYSATDFYFSAITPTAAGGQPAALIIMMNRGVPAAIAAMALLENIIMYTASLVIIGVLCFIINPAFFLSFDVFSRICIIVGLAVQLVLIWFYFMCMVKDKAVLKVCDWGLGILCRLHLMKNYDEKKKKLAETITQYSECGKNLRRERKLHVHVLLCNLAQRFSVICVPICLFLGQGGHARQTVDAFSAQTMAILGSNAMPLPGAVGISDFLFLKGFGGLVSDPVSLDLLSRGISFYCTLIICGLVVLIEIIMNKFKDYRASELVLRFTYGTKAGKPARRFITSPWVSLVVGRFMDTRLSKICIKGFIKNNSINMADYVEEDYCCFNDCFTRHIKPELRPVDFDADALISPCDGMMSAYHLSPDCRFSVKQIDYTAEELIRDAALAKRYENGVCLVLRLGVHDYHRYCYIDNGTKSENVFIKGRYNPVMPYVSLHNPVFRQNSREYCVLHTENFGDVVQVEVGACLVGRIVNRDGAATIRRGDEKGMFEYGGSTIVLFFEKGVIELNEEVFEKTKDCVETPVLYGAKIAEKAK